MAEKLISADEAETKFATLDFGLEANANAYFECSTKNPITIEVIEETIAELELRIDAQLAIQETKLDSYWDAFLANSTATLESLEGDLATAEQDLTAFTDTAVSAAPVTLSSETITSVSRRL